jgi:hypothetical protein
VFNIASIHGRGCSSAEIIALRTPLTIPAAAEAIGPLIKIVFIAPFTNRCAAHERRYCCSRC